MYGVVLFGLGGCLRRGSALLVGGDLAYAGWIRLGLAVAGEETVDLLLDVGELGVAEALDRFVSQQG
jgi:hypothetical protein